MNNTLKYTKFHRYNTLNFFVAYEYQEVGMISIQYTIYIVHENTLQKVYLNPFLKKGILII